MITFKEYNMLMEAPTTPDERKLAQQTSAQMTAAPTTPVAPNGGVADPTAQGMAGRMRNDREMMNPTQPQGAPAGQGVGAATAAPAAPGAAVAQAPVQQDPVTGPEAIKNSAERIMQQPPEAAVPNLINLKQQFDQQAIAASDAANAERDAGAEGEAVMAIRGWNQTEQLLGQQARTLKSQIQDPAMQQQLTDVFGESWNRIRKGLPLIVEQNNRRFKIIVA